MKQIIISIFIFISMGIVAQEKAVEEGKGFNSVFQKLKSGSWEGSVKGFIQLKDTCNNIFFSSTIDENAHLENIPDKNEIYDVSFKNYIVDNSNMKIKYTTYNRANVFKISIPNGEYQFNLIDGSCEVVIKGLKYEYFETEKSELLILYFVKDVGLFPSRYIRGAPVVFVAEGSTLVFQIIKS